MRTALLAAGLDTAIADEFAAGGGGDAARSPGKEALAAAQARARARLAAEAPPAAAPAGDPVMGRGQLEEAWAKPVRLG